MKKIFTITVKIKETKLVNTWFKEQSKKAAKLFNSCLTEQLNLIANGHKSKSQFDLAQYFRSFTLASDYKDRIYERIATSTNNWLKSEQLRYKIYWQQKQKELIDPNVNENLQKYPFLYQTQINILQRQNLYSLIKQLMRKQIITGKPRYRKKCSLAFSIRTNRQSTIKLLKNKLQITIPKLKTILNGKYNFLPSSSDYVFKLGTLKKDSCGTLWLKLTYEQNIIPAVPTQSQEKIIVGIDMGLKTTRTAVSINEVTKEIVEVYQPIRVRYFDKAFESLKKAYEKDTRQIAFVHRKIARRRLDNANKDIVKILSMGEEFKFGKPSSAFLFSGRLARSAADAANSLFLTRFEKRAELAGKISGEVNESYTSVTCRTCASKKPMPLSQRIYECNKCGHTEDRDVNSACQIALRNFLDLKYLQSA